MKVILLVFLLSTLTSAQAPKFDWQQVGSETFAMSADQTKYFLVGKPGRIRFDMKADEPIYVGVLSAEQFGRFSARKVMLVDFNRFACAKRDIVEGTDICVVSQPNARLAIRDKRGPITKLAGAYSTVSPKGNAAVADRASKENKVTLTVYRWACVENCRQ